MKTLTIDGKKYEIDDNISDLIIMISEERDRSLTNVAKAFEVIKKAMEDDDPSIQGSFAHVWHCNIAMMCVDSIREGAEEIPHEQAYLIGQEAASRFMKLCFDVETKA